MRNFIVTLFYPVTCIIHVIWKSAGQCSLSLLNLPLIWRIAALLCLSGSADGSCESSLATTGSPQQRR
jgi:hypothetical protein